MGRRVGAIALRLVLAALATAATVLVGAVAVRTSTGQRLDDLAWAGGDGIQGPIADTTSAMLHIVSPALIAVVMLVCLALCAARRDLPDALGVVLVVGGANLTTQVIKNVLLDRPVLNTQNEITDNSFPSGHTTVLTSLAVAVALSLPRRLRPLGPLLVAGTAASSGAATVAAGWHRPSDALGAFLVVAAWLLLALAVRTALVDGEPGTDAGDTGGTRTAERVEALLLLGVSAAAGVAALVVLGSVPRPLDGTDVESQRLAFRGTAAGLLAAASLLGALMAVLVPGPPRSAGLRGVYRESEAPPAAPRAG
jgi:membrane-associated phospholipid phosphatase